MIIIHWYNLQVLLHSKTCYLHPVCLSFSHVSSENKEDLPTRLKSTLIPRCTMFGSIVLE